MRAFKIHPVRVNHKVLTTSDGSRTQGDVEITGFPVSHCHGLIVEDDLVSYDSSGFLWTSRRDLTMSTWAKRTRSELCLCDGRGPRISIPSRPPLVGPSPLALPAVTICLCAPASVVPSVLVRGVDAGGLGILHTDCEA